MRNLKYILSTLQGINRNLVIVLMLTLSFMGCTVADDWSPYESSAALSIQIVGYRETTISGTTVGDPSYKWTLEVLQGGEFCSAVKRFGVVGNPFSLKFDTNSGEEPRVAQVRITFSDNYTKTFTIRQLVRTENPDYDRAWGEQPEYIGYGDYIHKVYYTTLSDGRRVRNYSVCYDTEKMCSQWVAYPAHSLYTSGRNYQTGGSTAGRTNAWAFDDAVTRYKESSNYNTAYEITSTYDSKLDTYNTYTNPIIPQSKQANICYTNGFGSGYARGHMLPSATRYNTWQTNAQTCYATNIMVQNYKFNGGSWATLENTTRNQICSDTLFVVVGTIFEDNNYINRFERRIGVPTHCYKLWLRTKSGKTGKHISDITSADDLISIGFLYENSSDGNSTTMSEAAVSVAEIERRTGFVFFRNLSPEIADEVKAQKNLKDWGL